MMPRGRHAFTPNTLFHPRDQSRSPSSRPPAAGRGPASGIISPPADEPGREVQDRLLHRGRIRERPGPGDDHEIIVRREAGPHPPKRLPDPTLPRISHDRASHAARHGKPQARPLAGCVGRPRPAVEHDRSVGHAPTMRVDAREIPSLQPCGSGQAVALGPDRFRHGPPAAGAPSPAEARPRVERL
jgi:hypothetical protein